MNNNKPVSLDVILDTLLQVDTEVFAKQVIRNDLLYRKIDKDDYKKLIFNAKKCGQEYALKVMEEAKTNDIAKIANHFKIDIRHANTRPGARRLLFASFTTPNKVSIMTNSITDATHLIKKNFKKYSKMFSYANIFNVLLAHEMFHFFEIKHKKEIYTQDKKIILWKFLGYKHTSNIRALSEIAAMSFAKTISGVDFQPYLLDVVLYYPFNNVGATNLYNKILEIKKEIDGDFGAKK